ncbi:MAG: hypothetical protein R3C19_07875 [Planctomycetaceae bacterium]
MTAFRSERGSEHGGVDRRDVLKSAVASALAGGTFPASAAAFDEPPTAPRSSLISEENSRTGTTDWQLTRVRINSGKYRTSLIEGYCSRQSVAAADTLQFFVSTEPARRFTIDVYRMGYYGGSGGRFMRQLGPFDGKTQPVPPIGPLPGRLRGVSGNSAPRSHFPGTGSAACISAS